LKRREIALIREWQGNGDQWAIVGEAARALSEGKLVAFPTETVYGIAASALHAEAIDRLVHSRAGRTTSR
jgi:tRNA A37 threonylcarbamoyladenosine synthetase subunit TsaC/SUA5/YrdC